MQSVPFFRRNIDTKGRVIRAIMTVALAIAAYLTWPHSRLASVALGISAVVGLIEASFSWCVLRACGLKTKF